MQARILLVAPSGSYRTFAYIEAAQSLGIDLLVASSGRHSLVTPLVGGLHLDVDDPAALQRLLEAGRESPFAGVIATDDQTVEIASRVAEALGLAHNPLGAARFSRRKDLARQCLDKAGLPVPRHRVVDLRTPLDPQLDGIDYPCVVKPLSLSTSRGVIRADDQSQLQAAILRVRALLAAEAALGSEEKDLLLVERFISGPELAVEALLHRGQLQVLAVFDKPDPMEGPFFEETYYVTPSRHAPAVQFLIRKRLKEACRAYGLCEGPVHAELRLSEGDAWIMEIASRTIGGDCARLLRFGTGHGLEELVLAQAAGHPLPAVPEQGGAGVLMIPIPRHGILRRVEGVLAARRVRYIEDVEISRREGYELVPLPEGASYLGFIFARAPTPEQAEQALREAHAELDIVVAPVMKITDRR